MPRRILAALVLLAELPACFLFAGEEPEREGGGAAPAEGGSGGGGGEGVLPHDSCASEGAQGALRITADSPAPDLPLTAEAIARVRDDPSRIQGDVTLELWVRPEASAASACPTKPATARPNDVPAPEDDPLAALLASCDRGLVLDRHQPVVSWSCLTGDPARDVCGPLVTLVDDRGAPQIELRIFGACIGGQIRSGGPKPYCIEPNVVRFSTPTERWTHVAVALGEQPGSDIGLGSAGVGFVINGDGGRAREVTESFVFSAGALRLGRSGDDAADDRLDATIDEVRLWATRRATGSIERSMGREPPPTDVGALLSRWSFDDRGRVLSPEDPRPIACDDLAADGPVVLSAGQQVEADRLGLEEGLRAATSPSDGCASLNATLPSWVTPEGVALCSLPPDDAPGAALEARDDELCAAGFSLCAPDAPALAALLTARGAEGVPHCFALSGARDAWDGDARVPIEQRACHATCEAAGLAPPPAPVEFAAVEPFLPERLAIGAACSHDRTGPSGDGCVSPPLPATRPIDGRNPCGLFANLHGVACCPD